MIQYAPREELVEYIRKVLVGPAGAADEVIDGTPFLRYMAGILFPQGTRSSTVSDQVSATADEEVPADAEAGEGESGSERSLELATEALPSAVGISFKVADDEDLECECWAALYEREGARTSDLETGKAPKRRLSRGAQKWKRKPICTPEQPCKITIRKGCKPQGVLDGHAVVSSRWRTQSDGTAIVTVSLVNSALEEKASPSPARALFQVGLRCSVGRGREIQPYPEVGGFHGEGSEEQEVEFLYRKSRPYARGHGAAATWTTDGRGKCDAVSVDFVPTADVPYATFKIDGACIDEQCLQLDFLDSAPRTEVITALRTLETSYRDWIEVQRGRAQREKAAVAARFVDRASHWLERMARGIALLEKDDSCWQAFRLANRAMGMQMVLYGRRRKQPHTRAENKGMPAVSLHGSSWRPFQVAFFLGAVESAANPASAHRVEVDVIWFPTGGGKTEAYLLLTAFELIHRRLIHGSRDTATGVLSRYTYRFLTAQQFQRTAALIVSLELLRVGNRSLLGERRFSLGLWVGGSMSPNNFSDAHAAYEAMMDSARPANTFILEACPCCNTEIVPSESRRAGQRWDPCEFGIESTPAAFHFRCTSDACPFHAETLPLNVVDTALYKEPPSMLLGTIDKFAQLPWDKRSRSFFGGPGDDSVPPSLVIQDELHLISGPLGSLAAPYEAAIDTIIEARGGGAKRIASTATIRNASEQVRGLYGRPACVFPSPCGSWDDAFFFRTDFSRPGRKYVGVMGQGHIKPVVALAWTAAAILQSVNEVALDAEALDAYWTLLAYHNSRRELGRTMTAARDEIETRVGVIASSSVKARRLSEPLELSANMTRGMTEATRELERHASRGNPSVDLVPCTSIISVGVDLARLGIMLVNGQPKLTSEYIQATSRVGRGDVPGLVVTLFSAAKPRDRSHYEDFRAYHEAIYRHVEPTSVTPYAMPARERTLHAALVTVVRHALDWQDVADAGKVDFDSVKLSDAVANLMRIVRKSDQSEADAADELVKDLLAEWRSEAESGKDLFYENRQAGMQFHALLGDYGKPAGNTLWRTMNSMRNVDSEVELKVQ